MSETKERYLAEDRTFCDVEMEEIEEQYETSVPQGCVLKVGPNFSELESLLVKIGVKAN